MLLWFETMLADFRRGLFSGDHLLVEYNVKVLQNVLDALLPQHCLIFYLNKVPFAIVEVQNQVHALFCLRYL